MEKLKSRANACMIVFLPQESVVLPLSVLIGSLFLPSKCVLEFIIQVRELDGEKIF